MRYRPLGPTGMFVSEIALGTGRFGAEPPTQGEVDTLFQAALDAGINLFDCADVYGEGLAEQMLGQAIKNLGVPRSSILITSKGFSPTGNGPNDRGASRGHIMDAVKASLDRLGTDHIDLYQIHSDDPLTPVTETVRALDDLISQGLVRYVGCSNWRAYRMMKALGIADALGASRFVSTQNHYSLAMRDVERDIVPCCLEEDLGMLVWSPQAGGILASRDVEVPWYLRFDLDLVRRCFDVMEEIASEVGVAPSQIGLAWLLSRPVVTSLLVGARDPLQLAQCVAAADIALSEDQMSRLDAVSALPPHYPDWIITASTVHRAPPSLRLRGE